MIKAIIFDLDGTLVQTEVLKATSYAKATTILTENKVSEEKVLEVFQDYVGLSRENVLQGLSKDFENEFKKALNIEDLSKIQEKLINKRLELYQQMIDDEALLSKYFCQHTLALFHQVFEDGFQVVLATMSHFEQAKQVTSMMGIYDKFDAIFTKDDVQEGKPSPEIYLKAKEALGLAAEQCLVIEDSVNGIKAAQNARMPVFAVTNDVTRKSVHDCDLLDGAFVVDHLSELTQRVYGFINQTRGI